MAKHLTASDIVFLVGLIDSWEGKLTWDAVCDEGKNVIGTRPTRQTLHGHDKIKRAYQSRKEYLKNGVIPSRRPASLNIADQRIRRLEGENKRLVDENERLLERFLRWQYNAYKRGMSQKEMDAALPPINRDSSES